PVARKKGRIQPSDCEHPRSTRRTHCARHRFQALPKIRRYPSGGLLDAGGRTDLEDRDEDLLERMSVERLHPRVEAAAADQLRYSRCRYRAHLADRLRQYELGPDA